MKTANFQLIPTRSLKIVAAQLINLLRKMQISVDYTKVSNFSLHTHKSVEKFRWFQREVSKLSLRLANLLRACKLLVDFETKAQNFRVRDSRSSTRKWKFVVDFNTNFASCCEY